MISAGMGAGCVVVDKLLLDTEESAARHEVYLLLGEAALVRGSVWSVAVLVAHGGHHELHARDVGHVLVQSEKRVVALTQVHQIVVDAHEAVRSFGVCSAIIVTPIPHQTIVVGRNGIPAYTLVERASNKVGR